MTTAPFSLHEEYWDNITIEDPDLELLYNYLLEIESPQTTEELTRALIDGRIEQEKDALAAQQDEASEIYLPKNSYEIDQILLFPALDYKRAKVTGVRPGNNPDMPAFEVVEVEFDDGEKLNFAASLEQHSLNEQDTQGTLDPSLDVDLILSRHENALSDQLSEVLNDNPDLVRIAWRWFPRALLVDVNIGHLNLAEALLEMEDGGPLPPASIIEQIELPTDVNKNLTEFSLNLALQEDGRFDDVGAAGEIMWFLRRLEPEEVQTPPVFLQYHPHQYDITLIEPVLEEMLADQVTDELEPDKPLNDRQEVTISLIYPHWRSGTLPLSGMIDQMFPTAYESPRVQFTFIDEKEDTRFSGWVVRPSKSIHGLKEWYESNGLIPGSLIHIKQGNKPGEVIIRADTHRPTREWIRTVLVGSDGGVVFAMLKQHVSAAYDDRMAVAISDNDGLDKIWQDNVWGKKPLKTIVLMMMKELTKLNPQGHVHAHELYAAVNIIRRCPPGPILSILAEQQWATYLGDLYFRLTEDLQEN